MALWKLLTYFLPQKPLVKVGRVASWEMYCLWALLYREENTLSKLSAAVAAALETSHS